MLTEVRCDKFRTDRIPFRPGLNVVLGDENGTNSIGKSTLLMVIDFAFGGNSLLKHNIDLVAELGDHDYFFSFTFNRELMRFRRGTFQPDLVYKCSEDYQPTTPIPIEEYTAILKAAYGIQLEEISFRSLVGLYFRVWGKDNLSVQKPLHVVQVKPGRECVDNLIKTFDRFGPIKKLANSLKVREEERKALNAAFKTQIIPKIDKRKAKANESRIAAIETEIDDIKVNLAKYATNISEVVNREVLELKLHKDKLLSVKLDLESKLARIQGNITGNRHIKSRHFAALSRFFPEIDKGRLTRVEEFHSGVAKLLKTELRGSEANLKENLARIDAEIANIEARMAKTLSTIDQPTVIVDRVYDLAVDLGEARHENLHFENNQCLREDIKGLKKSLSARKAEEIELIKNILNDTLRRIVTLIFGPERKSPEIGIEENSYTYEVFEDTGTGTAYASLIVLDLAVFQATILPFIAHDSLLFKNVENDSVANLFRFYLSIEKQSFVAIDEIDKYGKEASAMLRKQSVIQLNNTNVLYVKDWRG